jgi:CDP-diglyceride synthetase
MKQEDLKSKTSEKLESELKSIKTITGALIGVLSILFAVTIYGLIAIENKTTFIALIAVAISCSAILPSQFSSMKKIKAELELRKNS